MRFGWVGFEAKCPLPGTTGLVNMAGGGKRSRHLCSRALDPDRGSSAPDRAGSTGNRSVASTSVDAATRRRSRPPQCPAVRAAGSVASSRAHVIEGASAWGALGSCMRRRRGQAPMARRGQNRRGERLESFQEDAPRGGGRHGRRTGVAVESGIGDGADGGQGERRAGERPLLSHGAASTFASATATRSASDGTAPSRPRTGHLAHRGLERGGLRLDSRPVSCSRARSTSRQRLRVCGVRLAEGRRRIHQARDQRSASHRGRRDARHKHFLVGWMQLTTPVVSGGGDVTAGDLNCEPASSWRDLSVRSDVDAIPRAVCDPIRTHDPPSRSRRPSRASSRCCANFDEWGVPAGRSPDARPAHDWHEWAAGRCGRGPRQLDRRTRSSRSAITNWDIHDEQALRAPRTGAAAASVDQPELNVAGTTDTVDNCPSRRHGRRLRRAFGDARPVLDGLRRCSRAPATPSGRSIRSTPSTRCSPTASSTRVTRRCRPRRSTSTSPRTAGDTGDNSGVGYLYPAWKSEDNSRDGKGTTRGSQPRPPFYSQYIPATRVRPTPAVRRTARCSPRASRRLTGGRLQRLLVDTDPAALPATGTSPRNTSLPPGHGFEVPVVPVVFRATSRTTGRSRTATAPCPSTPMSTARPTTNFVPGFGFYFATSAQELERRLRPQGRRPARYRQRERHGPLPVPGGRPRGSGRRARCTSRSQPVPEDRPVLRQGPAASEHQHPRRPRPRAGHRRLAARARDRVLDGERPGGGCIAAFPSGPGGDIWPPTTPREPDRRPIATSILPGHSDPYDSSSTPVAAARRPTRTATRRSSSAVREQHGRRASRTSMNEADRP